MPSKVGGKDPEFRRKRPDLGIPGRMVAAQTVEQEERGPRTLVAAVQGDRVGGGLGHTAGERAGLLTGARGTAVDSNSAVRLRESWRAA